MAKKKSFEEMQADIDELEQMEQAEENLPEFPDRDNGKESTALLDESAEYQKFAEEEAEKEIPSSGYLFASKDKYLPEVTRLNEREIFAFAVGDVQDAVLDPDRTKSVYQIFKLSAMRNKIGFEGKGREEHIVIKQQEAEKEADAASRGALFGRGS